MTYYNIFLLSAFICSCLDTVVSACRTHNLVFMALHASPVVLGAVPCTCEHTVCVNIL